MWQIIGQIIQIIIFYGMFALLLYIIWRNGRNNERREQALIDAIQTATETNRKLAEYIMRQQTHE